MVAKFRDTHKTVGIITVSRSKRIVVSAKRATTVSQANEIPPESQACSLATTIKITLVQRQNPTNQRERLIHRVLANEGNGAGLAVSMLTLLAATTSGILARAGRVTSDESLGIFAPRHTHTRASSYGQVRSGRAGVSRATSTLARVTYIRGVGESVRASSQDGVVGATMESARARARERALSLPLSLSRSRAVLISPLCPFRTFASSFARHLSTPYPASKRTPHSEAAGYASRRELAHACDRGGEMEPGAAH